MKPALMLAVIFGAVIAGAAGGYVASQLATPAQQAPAPAPVAENHDDDARNDSKNREFDALSARLTREVDSLNERLAAAEVKAKEAGALDAKVKDLVGQLEAIRSNPTSAPAGTAPAMAPSDLDKMVDARIEAREKEQQATREAEQEKRFEEMRTNNVKRSLDTLTEKLALNSEQVPKVKALLETFSTKGAELWRKAGEARRNNTEFDMRAEMAAANTEATEQMKGLLSSAQLTTFNELVGERGLRSVTDQGWGPGTGQNGPGNNRPRGNRGND